MLTSLLGARLFSLKFRFSKARHRSIDFALICPLFLCLYRCPPVIFIPSPFLVALWGPEIVAWFAWFSRPFGFKRGFMLPQFVSVLAVHFSLPQGQQMFGFEWRSSVVLSLRSISVFLRMSQHNSICTQHHMFFSLALGKPNDWKLQMSFEMMLKWVSFWLVLFCAECLLGCVFEEPLGL